MKALCICFIILAVFSSKCIAQIDINKQKNTENFYLAIQADKNRERTKIFFENNLYNFDSFRTLLQHKDYFTIEIIQDSALVSRILKADNKYNLQLIKVHQRTQDNLMTFTFMQTLKPYLFTTLDCGH